MIEDARERSWIGQPARQRLIPLVTHDVEQMVKLVDHCFIVADGRIAGEGPPEAVRHSDDPAVDQFMNGKVDGPIPFHYDQARGASGS